MENDASKPSRRPDPESLFRYSLLSLVFNHGGFSISVDKDS
jgi:hypothetical protein